MKKPMARAVQGVGPDLVSGRSVFRAPKGEPASHKVRPYNESIASSHRFVIRVHPWFNCRFFKDYNNVP